MITFYRIASIASGKTSSAIAFAHDIAAYIKKTYDLELEVLIPIGGNPQRVAWSARYKDLAAYDAVGSKLISDKQYWEIVGKGADNFIAGSIRDSIWRTT